MFDFFSVRHRLPAFMREAPNDAEVTKKMKRAANTIDKFRSVYHIKTVLRKTT